MGAAPAAELALERMGRWLERTRLGRIWPPASCPARACRSTSRPGARAQGGRFVLWTFVAALLWTPLLVLSVALLGGAVAGRCSASWDRAGPDCCSRGRSCLSVAIAFAHVVQPDSGAGELIATGSRLWRWEFWPSWLFYLPLLPWLAYLSLRYRGVLVWTAANPGIPDGGVVGESKFAILAQLPPEWVVPSFLDSARRARRAGSTRFEQAMPSAAGRSR